MGGDLPSTRYIVWMDYREFGDEKYIGTGNRSGEVHISGGETFGTDAVYPTCVFWPD